MLCIGIENYFKHSGLITPLLVFIGMWGSLTALRHILWVISVPGYSLSHGSRVAWNGNQQ